MLSFSCHPEFSKDKQQWITVGRRCNIMSWFLTPVWIKLKTNCYSKFSFLKSHKLALFYCVLAQRNAEISWYKATCTSFSSGDGASELHSETTELHGETGQPGEAGCSSHRDPRTCGKILQRRGRDPELHRLQNHPGRRPAQLADCWSLPRGFWDVFGDSHQQQRTGHLHSRTAGSG